MNAHALGPWLEVIKDILIPVAAILVSTIIAVWLARTERRAADEARAEERRLDVEAREEARRVAKLESLEQRRQEGGASALEAMDRLLQVAQETDTARAAEGLIRVRALLFEVTLKLQVHHSPVADWVIEELTIVSRVVAKRDAGGRAMLLEEIQARYAEFSIRVTSWRMDQTDDAWFADRESPLIEETPSAKSAD